MFDEIIYAVGVSSKIRFCCFVILHGYEGSLCTIHHAESAHPAIVVKIGAVGPGSENFGEPSGSSDRLKLHLPQPKLCMKITLCKISIGFALRKDVRHEAVIKINMRGPVNAFHLNIV